MAKLDSRSLDSPEETRTFDKGKFEVVRLEGTTVGRATFEPGWKWSECVKPIAGTESCQSNHVGYVVSGRIKVVMNDGAEAEAGPGEAYVIPPGHDAWVVGNDQFVGLEFQSAETYAKS